MSHILYVHDLDKTISKFTNEKEKTLFSQNLTCDDLQNVLSMTVLYLIVYRSNGFLFLPGIYEPPRMSKWTFEHWNEAHDRISRNNAKRFGPNWIYF